MHDDLTGMMNRRALNNKLPQVLKAADITGLSVVIAGIDLDGFKAVNDNFGHNAGDNLLKAVAKRIVRTSRKEDLVFRTGGDEFVMVLTGFDPKQAQAEAEEICNRLIDEISQPHSIDTNTVNVGASIGICLLYTSDAADE